MIAVAWNCKGVCKHFLWKDTYFKKSSWNCKSSRNLNILIKLSQVVLLPKIISTVVLLIYGMKNKRKNFLAFFLCECFNCCGSRRIKKRIAFNSISSRKLHSMLGKIYHKNIFFHCCFWKIPQARRPCQNSSLKRSLRFYYFHRFFSVGSHKKPQVVQQNRLWEKT